MPFQPENGIGGQCGAGRIFDLQKCKESDANCSVRWYYSVTSAAWTHGDRYNSSLQSWESKLGGDIRTIHNADGLEDGDTPSIYGNVKRFHRKTYFPFAEKSLATRRCNVISNATRTRELNEAVVPKDKGPV